MGKCGIFCLHFTFGGLHRIHVRDLSLGKMLCEFFIDQTLHVNVTVFIPVNGTSLYNYESTATGRFSTYYFWFVLLGSVITKNTVCIEYVWPQSKTYCQFNFLSLFSFFFIKSEAMLRHFYRDYFCVGYVARCWDPDHVIWCRKGKNPSLGRVADCLLLREHHS